MSRTFSPRRSASRRPRRSSRTQERSTGPLPRLPKPCSSALRRWRRSKLPTRFAWGGFAMWVSSPPIVCASRSVGECSDGRLRSGVGRSIATGARTLLCSALFTFFVSLFLCFFVSLFLCFFVSLFLCFFVSSGSAMQWDTIYSLCLEQWNHFVSVCLCSLAIALCLSLSLSPPLSIPSSTPTAPARVDQRCREVG